MSKITDQKSFLLQSVFRNQLSENELNFYANGSSIHTFDEEEPLFNSQKRFFLIIKGEVIIKSENNDPVTRLSSGFVGLSYLFTDRLWQRYQAYSSSGLQVLHLEPLIMLDMIKKFPAFQGYFFQVATELDVILTHHYSTENDISQRVDLSTVVSSLEELTFESGLYNAKIVKRQNSFVMLYLGDLMHEDGMKLSPGRIYNCSSLPDDGEWVNSGDTRLLYSSDSSDNLLNSNNEKLLEIPQEQTKEKVDAVNILDISDISQTSQVLKTNKHFKIKHYLPYIYILLFLVSMLVIIIISM